MLSGQTNKEDIKKKKKKKKKQNLIKKPPGQEIEVNCQHLTISNVTSLTLLGAFEDDEILHVEGEVNPVRDLEIISEELRLKDLEYMTKLVVSGARLKQGKSVACSL
jgi:hypothetical protein